MTRALQAHPFPLQQGFTLLEALIAVVVLSIGLLGIATIQFISLQNNVGAYGRSQATMAAYDIADRMRSNLPAAQAGGYLLNPADMPLANPGFNCQAAACTTAQMAQADLFQWSGGLAATNTYDLPGARARITCADVDVADALACTPGSIHTVIVMWDDQKTGAAGTNCGDDLTVDLTCFTVNVRP